MTDQPPPPPDQPPPYPGAYGQAPGQPPYGTPPGGWQPGGPPPGSPPPGSPPPPGGGYDPRWGYGPPGVPYGPQQPYPGQETTWAIFSYVGTLVVGFIAPLIIYCVKKNTEPFTRFHAAQVLNFQLTLLMHLLVVAVICVPPAIVLDAPAFLALFAFPYLELVIGQWVFLIIGAIKSGKRQYYRIPTFFCFRMIR